MSVVDSAVPGCSMCGRRVTEIHRDEDEVGRIAHRRSGATDLNRISKADRDLDAARVHRDHSRAALVEHVEQDHRTDAVA